MTPFYIIYGQYQKNKECKKILEVLNSNLDKNNLKEASNNINVINKYDLCNYSEHYNREFYKCIKKYNKDSIKIKNRYKQKPL